MIAIVYRYVILLISLKLTPRKRKSMEKDPKSKRESKTISLEELKENYNCGKKSYLCLNCKCVVQSWETFCDVNCIQEYMQK